MRKNDYILHHYLSGCEFIFKEFTSRTEIYRDTPNVSEIKNDILTAVSSKEDIAGSSLYYIQFIDQAVPCIVESLTIQSLSNLAEALEYFNDYPAE